MWRCCWNYGTWLTSCIVNSQILDLCSHVIYFISLTGKLLKYLFTTKINDILALNLRIDFQLLISVSNQLSLHEPHMQQAVTYWRLSAPRSQFWWSSAAFITHFMWAEFDVNQSSSPWLRPIKACNLLHLLSRSHGKLGCFTAQSVLMKWSELINAALDSRLKRQWQVLLFWL